MGQACYLRLCQEVFVCRMPDAFGRPKKYSLLKKVLTSGNRNRDRQPETGVVLSGSRTAIIPATVACGPVVGETSATIRQMYGAAAHKA